MSVGPVTFFVFISVYSCYIVTGEQIFDDGHEHRCMTPNNKPGHCVPLHNCPYMYQVLSTRYVITDEHSKKYLEKSLCRFDGKMPIICCEEDAGACITAEEKPGACVPFIRCNPLLQFLNEKPFINDQVVHYFRKSACTYGKKDKPRVCCPIFPTNITVQTATKDIFSPATLPNTTQSIKPNLIPASKSTSVLNSTSDLMPNSLGNISHSIAKPNSTLKPNISRVKLPIPGQDQCGDQGYDSKLIGVGGYETDIYDYPWMALLQAGDGSFPCGGSLITERYVLTAAHCVLGESVRTIKNITSVRLGEWDISSTNDCTEDFGSLICTDNPINIEVEEIVPHPEYNHETLQHDIALIRLKTPAPYTDFIRPICLPVKKINNSSLSSYTIAGWGATETARYSKIKVHVLGLPLYNKEKCKEVYSKIDPNNKVIIGAGHICVGGQSGKDSCPGDSGGPLMTIAYLNDNELRPIKVYVQVGIISFGYTVCGFENKPSVYTNVEEYIDWITNNMRI